MIYQSSAWQEAADTDSLVRTYRNTGWNGYRLRNRQAIEAEIAAFPVKPSVLDAACFVGMYSEACSGADYLGVDVTQKFVDRASLLYPDKCFAVADIRRLPIVDGVFDIVFNFGTIIHMDEPGRVISELWRVAKHTLLLESTTHKSGPPAIDMRNPQPEFLHRSYNIDWLNGLICGLTNSMAIHSSVGTYGGFQSTLWTARKRS